MEHMDLLISHMKDLSARALKTGCAASRFLTPAEARSVAEYFKYERVTLYLDGGFNGAERVRAAFLNPQWGEFNRSGLFAALKIVCRPQDILSHRDILGALMALGIERDTIGDIFNSENAAMLVCLPELSGYIIENLTMIGRVGISISKIALDDLPAKIEELDIKKATVASLRLDAVLCAAFGLTRAKSVELITSGRVKLNHMLCLQPAKEISEGCLLSVRGLGRAKLLETGGLSRKGRIYIRIGLYGR